MEYPSLCIMHRNSSSSPLNSSANILARAAVVSGPFLPQREASSSPCNSTWKSFVLEWLNSPYYGGRHHFDYRILGLSKRLDLAQELANFRTIFLLGASRAPAVALLQRNARKLGETSPDWIWKYDIINVEPLRGPLFRRLLRRAGQVSGLGNAPYFGSPHFKY